MVVTKQAARLCHWREALGINDKLDRSNTGRIHLIARSLSVRLSHSGRAAIAACSGYKNSCEISGCGYEICFINYSLRLATR